MADKVNRRISIFIDAVQAEAQLSKLIERQNTLIKTNAKIKEGSAAWKANQVEIEKLGKQIDLLGDQLSGKAGPSLDQLRKLQGQLNAALAKMPIELRKGSEEFKKLQQVNNIIAGIRK